MGCCAHGGICWVCLQPLLPKQCHDFWWNGTRGDKKYIARIRPVQLWTWYVNFSLKASLKLCSISYSLKWVILVGQCYFTNLLRLFPSLPPNKKISLILNCSASENTFCFISSCRNRTYLVRCTEYYIHCPNNIFFYGNQWNYYLVDFAHAAKKISKTTPVSWIFNATP